jgi:hypothetical protein
MLEQVNEENSNIEEELTKIKKRLEEEAKEESLESVFLALDKFVSFINKKRELEKQITKIKTDYEQANNSALQTAGQLDAQKKANQELNKEIEKLKNDNQVAQLALTTQMIAIAGENEELTNKLKNSQEQCQNLERQITDLIISRNDKTQQSQTAQQEVIQEIKPLKTDFEKKLETVKGELREKVLEGSTDDYLSARELLINIFTEFPELNSENLLS